MHIHLGIGVMVLNLAITVTAGLRIFCSTGTQKPARTLPSFHRFNSQQGQQFLTKPYGENWSCSSCHSANPKGIGNHFVTQKPIEPLAPPGNGESITHLAKVENWFKRNVKDVVKRACTPEEKGDVLTYLLTVTR